MGVFSTIFTGTILATGKTFAHGLSATPDFVTANPTAASATSPITVQTFDATNVVLGGAVDGVAFRCNVIKLHSLIN